jgi:hypothetical protein
VRMHAALHVSIPFLTCSPASATMLLMPLGQGLQDCRRGVVVMVACCPCGLCAADASVFACAKPGCGAEGLWAEGGGDSADAAAHALGAARSVQPRCIHEC